MRSKGSIATLLLAGLLAGAGTASAQVYKWTDAKGVVHYGDQPPPENVKTERKSFNAGAGADLPYTLAQAVRKNPVILYTTSSCAVCDQGRSLLEQRGIPFTEKTVVSEEDQQQLNQAGGDGRLPLLLIGSTKLVGFEEGNWNSALTSASYPKQRMLPADYRNPAAQSAAAPKPVEEAKPESPPKPPPPAKKKAPENAPPGFQF